MSEPKRPDPVADAFMDVMTEAIANALVTDYLAHPEQWTQEWLDANPTDEGDM